MPAGREIISNTPLSGTEVREIILNDARRLVENHGLLANHVAYGAIGYELILRLHLKNAVFSDTSIAAQHIYDTSMKSRPIARNIVKDHPELSAIDTPPLVDATEDNSVVLGERVTREIDSPNVERLREGLPIPTPVRQQDGSTIIEYVKREAQVDLGPGNVSIDDDTAAARAEWKLPPEPEHTPQVGTLVSGPAMNKQEPQKPPISGVIPVTPEMDNAAEAERKRKLDSFFGGNATSDAT